MKAFFKLPITLLIGIWGVGVECPVLPELLPAFVRPESSAHAQIQPALQLSLPMSAVISFRITTSGTTPSAMEGRVLRLDPQQRLLVVQGVRTEHTLPIRTVQKVSFSRHATAFSSDGRPILRSGNQFTAGQPLTLGPVPMSGLRIVDDSRGRATLQLGSRSAPRPAVNQTYVVDELEFDAQQGTVTVRATPYQ